jgi:transmembrane sensor
MSEPVLPTPVRRVLTDSIDDARLARLWQGLAAKRARRVMPVRRAWLVGVVPALVAAMLVAFLLRAPSGSPLHLADGRDIPAKMANGGATRLTFDDGSAIDVEAGSGLDLLESTARSFAVAIRGGATLFDVTPGGPRTWRIECGPVTVEVVGTRFTVERAPTFVRVAVSRGAVLVRGEKVPDRVVRLGPGQAIVVPLAAPTADGEARTAPRIGVTTDMDGSMAAPTHPSAPRLPTAAPSSEPSPSPSGSVARFEAPAPAPGSSIADGLAAADALRREGRFSEAAGLLERALAEHGGDASAALAEFSLGRLYLDSLGNADAAKTHFARALARGLPSAIAEDAQARLVEASARAGDLAEAMDKALRYHARYPGGRHASDVDRRAAGAP